MIHRPRISQAVLSIIAGALICHAQAPTALTSLPSSAYEHVYRHVLHLKSVDAASVASGKPTNFSAYYKNLANLTQPQADSMASVSQAAVSAIDALDQQAQALILQWRAQTHAKLLPGQKPPAPPAQLTALQASRNALLDSYHSQLVQTLGPAAFNTLEQALIATYKVGAQTTPGQPGH